MLKQVMQNNTPGLWKECKGCKFHAPKNKEIKCSMYNDWRGEKMTNSDECGIIKRNNK